MTAAPRRGRSTQGAGGSGRTYPFEEPERRRYPKAGEGGLEDGNYLAFAIACRWLSDLAYVHNGSSKGDDILRYYREGFDLNAQRLQLIGIRSVEELRETYSLPKT